MLDLLGPGDDEFASSRESWSYHLGRSSAWWLHEERLYVSFGPDGRLREASIGVED